MDIEIPEEIEEWIVETIEMCEDDDVTPEFFVEKFEHAFIVRWGSKKGDFPQIGSGGLTDEYLIIGSGELHEGGIVIADTDSKKAFNMDTMAYKYLTKTLMKGCEKGYETVVNAPDGKYKIRVERINAEDTPNPHTR